MKGHRNKWTYLPQSQAVKLNILNRPILSKLISKCNAIPIKTPTDFLIGTCQVHPQINSKEQKEKYSQEKN